MLIIAALVAVALGLVVILAWTSRWVPAASRGRPPASTRPPGAATTPAAEPVLAAARAVPQPIPAILAAALAPGTHDAGLGGQLAGAVLDADGRAAYGLRATAMLPPASTAKLATAVAALAVLGTDARLTTTVTRTGSMIVLVGGGDPLLASPKALRADPALASLDRLATLTAARLRQAGTSTVQLGYDTSRYSGPAVAPGWKPGYLTGNVAPVSALMVDEGRLRPDRPARAPDPAASAARAFAAQLAVHGVRVLGAPKPAHAGGAPGAPGGALAAVSAPTVAGLVQRMLTTSDNSLAEALAREVAGRSALPRSFAGATAGVRRAVAAVGVDPAGLVLVDASGLSTLDRARPATLAALLVTAIGRPTLHALFAGLPVAGFTGTLAGRFRSGPAAAAAGVVRAKTGTLSGVSTLSGVVVDRDGAVLAFAFLAPEAASRSRAQAALDRLAATLAGCGCR